MEIADEMEVTVEGPCLGPRDIDPGAETRRDEEAR